MIRLPSLVSEHLLTTPAWIYEGDALDKMASIPTGSVDLVVSSPPYNIGKIYERDRRLSFREYLEWQELLITELPRLLTETGSVCWQVGNYVKDGTVVPLDIPFYELFLRNGFQLRNRIIWKFNFGRHSDRRFSGRYETLLWFTKSNNYKFNLDPVRVPQLYPGKRHSKSRKKGAGLPSGNPKGKNPSDYWEFSAERDFRDNPVWDIPNVKWNHPEKTFHPCQFPIELAERCVLALTDESDIVLDPFVGTGASIIAAVKHGRVGLGIEKEPEFANMARERILELRRGELPMRPSGLPVRRPIPSERVARIPEEWLMAADQGPIGGAYGEAGTKEVEEAT